MKNIAQDLSEINGTQSLNRNFITRTTPTSPAHVHSNDLMGASSKSTSNLNTSSTTKPIVLGSNRNTTYHDAADSWTHGSHTLDSRLGCEQSHNNDSKSSDIDADDDYDGSYLMKIKNKTLVNRLNNRPSKPDANESSRQKQQPTSNGNMNKIHSRKEIKDINPMSIDPAQALYEEPNRVLIIKDPQNNQRATNESTTMIDDGKIRLNKCHRYSILSSYSSLSETDFIENYSRSFLNFSSSLKFSSSSQQASSCTSQSSLHSSFSSSSSSFAAYVDYVGQIITEKAKSLPKMRQCVVDLVQMNKLPSINACSFQDDTVDGSFDNDHAKNIIDTLDLSVGQH
jgi:hypothetical protein